MRDPIVHFDHNGADVAVLVITKAGKGQMVLEPTVPEPEDTHLVCDEPVVWLVKEFIDHYCIKCLDLSKFDDHAIISNMRLDYKYGLVIAYDIKNGSVVVYSKDGISEGEPDYTKLAPYRF